VPGGVQGGVPGGVQGGVPGGAPGSAAIVSVTLPSDDGPEELLRVKVARQVEQGAGLVSVTLPSEDGTEEEQSVTAARREQVRRPAKELTVERHGPLESLCDLLTLEDGADDLIAPATPGGAQRKEWTLLHGRHFELSPEGVEQLMVQVPIDTKKPGVVDVVFLVAARADGQRFPSKEDVQSGRLLPGSAMLMRTKILTRGMRMISLVHASSTPEQRVRAAIMSCLKDAPVHRYAMQHFGATVLVPRKVPRRKVQGMEDASKQEL